MPSSPTASLAVPGDHGWLLEDLSRLYALGWRELDIVALYGLPRDNVVDRLRRADVIYAEGGNPVHLANNIIVNDLTEEIRQLLKDRVYVGVSAGAMIFSTHLNDHDADALGLAGDLEQAGSRTVLSPFSFFDWAVKPHWRSPHFAQRDDTWAERFAAGLAFPVYLLDDDSAVRVDDEAINMVSGGAWKLLRG